jgi:MFS transporter, putative metabolite:H+ symporter
VSTQQLSIAVPAEVSAESLSAAQVPAVGTVIDNLPLNRRHWLVFFACSAAFLLDSLDLQVLGLAAPSITQDWGVDAKAMGFVFSATFVGMLLGSLTFGTAADRIGRRNMLLFTVLFFSIFAALCAAASNVMSLAVLRFFVGIGVGGLIPVSLSMVTETMPSKYRGTMATLWAIFLSLGNFAAAGAAALILPHYGWQVLIFAAALPGVFVLALLSTIPESPRFLLRTQQREKAARALSWLAGTNVFPTDDRSVASDEARAPRFSVLELFTPQYRRRTALVCAIWFFYSISYFGLVLFLPLIVLKKGIFSQQQAYYYVMGFATAAVLGRLVTALTIDKWGRRPVMLVCTLGAAAAAILLGAAEMPWSVVAAGLLLGFFQDAGAGTYVTWTPELFPTRARSTSVGFAGGASRIAAIISPAIVGTLMSDRLNLVFVLFAGGYLVTCLVTLLLRDETKSMGLEKAALSSDA